MRVWLQIGMGVRHFRSGAHARSLACSVGGHTLLRKKEQRKGKCPPETRIAVSERKGEMCRNAHISKPFVEDCNQIQCILVSSSSVS